MERKTARAINKINDMENHIIEIKNDIKFCFSAIGQLIGVINEMIDSQNSLIGVIKTHKNKKEQAIENDKGSEYV